MTNILFFTSEPGGAETLTPVIRLLRGHAYEATVLTYGHAIPRFRRNGISFSEIQQAELDADRVVRACEPAYVITSATSLPTQDMAEKYFWEASRKAGIGTLAFNDQWQNYAERFSGSAVEDRLKYLPDHINCIDEIGRREMIEEGFSAGQLLTFGHPYLSEVAARYGSLDRRNAAELLGIPLSDLNRSETLIFVSEPLREYFGTIRGYDQYEALDLFLKNVSRLRTGVQEIVKLHPKDNPSKFTEIFERHRHLRIHPVQNQLASLECLTLSDRIFGMTSIMLIEAYLLGKSVVSVQPGLKVKDPLVLSRYGLIPRLDKHSDFDPFALKSAFHPAFPVAFDQTGFLNFIEGQVRSHPHSSP
jgi:hypothetical protein